MSGNTNNIIKRWGDFVKVLDTTSCTITQLTADQKASVCDLIVGGSGYIAASTSGAQAIQSTDYNTYAEVGSLFKP